MKCLLVKVALTLAQVMVSLATSEPSIAATFEGEYRFKRLLRNVGRERVARPKDGQ